MSFDRFIVGIFSVKYKIRKEKKTGSWQIIVKDVFRAEHYFKTINHSQFISSKTDYYYYYYFLLSSFILKYYQILEKSCKVSVCNLFCENKIMFLKKTFAFAWKCKTLSDLM